MANKLLSEMIALGTQVNGTGASAPRKSLKATYTKDGIEYKRDRWTQKYAPVEDFVSGKDYTRASYNKWTKWGKFIQKLQEEIVAGVANGTMDADEVKHKHELCEYMKTARNREPGAYEDVAEAESYLTLEDLLS